MINYDFPVASNLCAEEQKLNNLTEKIKLILGRSEIKKANSIEVNDLIPEKDNITFANHRY